MTESVGELRERASEGAPPYARAEVVVNPTSGRGLGVQAGRELVEGLRRNGVRVGLHVTRGRGDALRHLRGLGTELDLALAVGGDGTLREVLEGLVDPTTPVALVPSGTANVMAAELGLPRDVHHALEIVLRGRTRPLDVARVNGRLSFLCAGVGVDGYAVRNVETLRRGPITKWSYVRAIARALGEHRPAALRVTVDDEPLRPSWGYVLASNTSRYAGLVALDSRARIDDGEIEVYLFPGGSRRELVLAFARGVFRGLPGGGVEMRRARRVRIESDEPVACQVDGDAAGTTPVEVEVGEVQYRLVVP